MTTRASQIFNQYQDEIEQLEAEIADSLQYTIDNIDTMSIDYKIKMIEDISELIIELKRVQQTLYDHEKLYLTGE